MSEKSITRQQAGFVRQRKPADETALTSLGPALVANSLLSRAAIEYDVLDRDPKSEIRALVFQPRGIPETEAVRMNIKGIEGMTPAEVSFELQRGGKFVFYWYCVSLLYVTVKRPSDVYFIRAGESAVLKGLPFTLISLIGGWWGIPWGPIRTVQCISTNLSGGEPAPAEAIASTRAGVGLSGREV